MKEFRKARSDVVYSSDSPHELLTQGFNMAEFNKVKCKPVKGQKAWFQHVFRLCQWTSKKVGQVKQGCVQAKVLSGCFGLLTAKNIQPALWHQACTSDKLVLVGTGALKLIAHNMHKSWAPAMSGGPQMEQAAEFLRSSRKIFRKALEKQRALLTSRSLQKS